MQSEIGSKSMSESPEHVRFDENGLDLGVRREKQDVGGKLYSTIQECEKTVVALQNTNKANKLRNYKHKLI